MGEVQGCTSVAEGTSPWTGEGRTMQEQLSRKPGATIEHINGSAKFYWWLEKIVGAGDGNRTHVWSLGSSSSTIELHPHKSVFTAIPIMWWEDSVHPCTPPFGPSSHILMCSDVQNCSRQFCQIHVWSLGSSSSTIELHPQYDISGIRPPSRLILSVSS